MNSLWEILVPTIRNDKPVRTRYHKVWDEKVKKISGGLTILKPAQGRWVSPTGDHVNERMIPVRIACTEEEIEEIMAITIDHYDQEEVMAYRVSDIVKFKKRNE